MLEIGKVKRLQIQLNALKKGEEPNRYYDTAALRSVPAARLTVDGVTGLEEGHEMMDVQCCINQFSPIVLTELKFCAPARYRLLFE